MMHCCMLGGMQLAYDHEHEEFLHKTYPGINPYFYEFPPENKSLAGEPLQGKLVKLMGNRPFTLAAEHTPLSLVYMTRDPTAQFKSNQVARDRTYDPIAEGSRKSATIWSLRQHERIVSLAVFSYEEVIEDPISAFEQLKTWGWPLDPAEAAQGVDPTLKHY